MLYILTKHNIVSFIVFRSNIAQCVDRCRFEQAHVETLTNILLEQPAQRRYRKVARFSEPELAEFKRVEAERKRMREEAEFERTRAEDTALERACKHSTLELLYTQDRRLYCTCTRCGRKLLKRKGNLPSGVTFVNAQGETIEAPR